MRLIKAVSLTLLVGIASSVLTGCFVESHPRYHRAYYRPAVIVVR